MPSIKDSNTTTRADHSISLELNQPNFKTLQPDEAFTHLSLLAKMLDLSYLLVSKRLPKDGGTNPDLLTYLKKLHETLEAIVMKHKLDADKPNSDIRLSCTIDPSDSGFPVVVRDFKFLNTDKEQADAELQALPDDAKIGG